MRGRDLSFDDTHTDLHSLRLTLSVIGHRRNKVLHNSLSWRAHKVRLLGTVVIFYHQHGHTHTNANANRTSYTVSIACGEHDLPECSNYISVLKRSTKHNRSKSQSVQNELCASCLSFQVVRFQGVIYSASDGTEYKVDRLTRRRTVSAQLQLQIRNSLVTVYGE